MRWGPKWNNKCMLLLITIPSKSILPLSVCLFHKYLSRMTKAVYWWDVVCDGVKNPEWFPPVHKTQPVTWSAWISCIATISLVLSPSISFWAALQPHRIFCDPFPPIPSVSSSSQPHLKSVDPSALSAYWNLSHLQLPGQQTSMSFPILSVITSFIIICTFNLAPFLPSIAVIYRPVSHKV